MRETDAVQKIRSAPGRHEGRWCFADRLLSFLYYLPVDEYAQALGDRLRMRAYGDRRPADFPESLPNWQLYHGSS